jgi:hypothetical protein
MEGEVVKGMTQDEVILCLGKPTKRESETLYGATTHKWYWSRPVGKKSGLDRSRLWNNEIPLARVLFGHDGRVTHCRIFGRLPPPPSTSGEQNQQPPASSPPPVRPPDHVGRRPAPPAWEEPGGGATPGEQPDTKPSGPEAGDFDGWPALSLNGISSGGSTPTAFINRRVVSAGETVNGVKVLEITALGVLLEHEGDIQFLPMQQ